MSIRPFRSRGRSAGSAFFKAGPAATFCGLLGLLIFTACGDYEIDEEYDPAAVPQPFPTVAEYSERAAALNPVKEFTIPDSVNNHLLIAAYIEDHPRRGRTVLRYDDTSRTGVTKISYLDDSTIVTEPLQRVRDDEFRSKFTTETYVVNPGTVHWSKMTGAVIASFEYVRMDVGR